MLGSRETRQGDETHPRRQIVSLEQLPQFPGPAIGIQRVAERFDDPERMRFLAREQPLASQPGHGPHSPLVRGRAGQRAEHPVHESRCGSFAIRRDQRHGFIDRCVGRHPHPEELMRAEAEGVEHFGVELGQRPPRHQAQNAVIVALATEGAVAEFGGESGIRLAQMCLRELRGQQQVRVRVAFVDRAKYLIGDPARRLDPSGPGARALRAHAATTAAPAGRPRHQSTADMARFPAGCTVTR